MSGLTFQRFGALFERYPPEARFEEFERLPAHMQDACWDDLCAESDRAIEEELHDPILDEPPARPPRRTRAPNRPLADTTLRTRGEDPLLSIPPPIYVEHLADVEVPASGVIRCPLPGHEDRTPSFMAYADPERGVWCHGCQRGGSIYDFASALEGGPIGSALRGHAFKHVRAELLERFCRVGSVAA